MTGAKTTMSNYGTRSPSLGNNSLRTTFDHIKKGNVKANRTANLTRFNIQQTPVKGPVNV